MRICLEQSAFPGVIRVTEKVAHDVELVSGKKPQILVEKEITGAPVPHRIQQTAD